MARFVAFNNLERYHELRANLTLADVNLGRAKEVRTRGEDTKQRTLKTRRLKYLRLGQPTGVGLGRMSSPDPSVYVDGRIKTKKLWLN